MGRTYLIRYGLARVVSRFAADSETFERGQEVLVRTHRGTELGEVLAEAIGPDPDAGHAPILRAAEASDLEYARRVFDRRYDRFDEIRAIFEEGNWPMEVIDAEALLDPGRVVLHYLGGRVDGSGLNEVLRARLGLDVFLEPVGRDLPEPEPDPEPDPEPESHGCGDCGSSGGCGAGGCGAGCAVKAIVDARRRVPVDA